MREIKFRAWDESENEMVYGIDHCLWEHFDIYRLKVEQFFEHFPVMQYTGLKDNTKWEQLTNTEQREWIDRGETKDTWSGKEIYEGDIVRQKRCQCGDCKKYGEWRILKIDPFDYLAGNTCIARSEDMEVIGNIYLNKELLDDSK